jgi:hypothetical protein
MRVRVATNEPLTRLKFCQPDRPEHAGTKSMDRLQFIMPVRIVTEAGQPVTEIYGVEEALTFLQNWPGAPESPIYQRALNSCFAATIDQETADDARKALMALARVCGILARDMSVPVGALEPERRPDQPNA